MNSGEEEKDVEKSLTTEDTKNIDEDGSTQISKEADQSKTILKEGKVKRQVRET